MTCRPPTDPIEPLDATERIEPLDPTERIEPLDPMDSAEPAEPSDPNENADIAETAEQTLTMLRNDSTEAHECFDFHEPVTSAP